MSWAGNFYRSAIGKKAVMAVTGVILFGWIFLHMVGNLKLYLGAVHMNEYARWLRALGSPAVPETGALWISRVFHVGMLASLVFLIRGFHLGAVAWLGIAAVAGLLAWEHRLVRANDLSRIDAAFFTMNGYVSVIFFVFWAADIFWT